MSARVYYEDDYVIVLQKKDGSLVELYKKRGDVNE